MIYKTANAAETIRLLPLNKEVSYGWTSFCSLVAINAGPSYFEDKLWVVHLDAEVSWSDITYKAVRGCFFSFRRLKKIGYENKIIKFFEKQYYKENHLAHYAIEEIIKKGRVYRIFDILYFLIKFPRMVMLDLIETLRLIRLHFVRKFQSS